MCMDPSCELNSPPSFVLWPYAALMCGEICARGLPLGTRAAMKGPGPMPFPIFMRVALVTPPRSSVCIYPEMRIFGAMLIRGVFFLSLLPSSDGGKLSPGLCCGAAFVWILPRCVCVFSVFFCWDGPAGNFGREHLFGG